MRSTLTLTKSFTGSGGGGASKLAAVSTPYEDVVNTLPHVLDWMVTDASGAVVSEQRYYPYDELSCI